MEVENPMIMPEPRYRTQAEIDEMYEAMAEKEDREWEEN